MTDDGDERTFIAAYTDEESDEDDEETAVYSGDGRDDETEE